MLEHLFKIIWSTDSFKFFFWYKIGTFQNETFGNLCNNRSVKNDIDDINSPCSENTPLYMCAKRTFR